LATVLVVLLVVSLLVATLIPELSHARRRARVWQWQQQSRLLAESAIERARLRLELDAAYRGEIWRVPADRFSDASDLAPGSSDGAEVQIQVAAVEGQPRQVSIAVTARYPLDSVPSVTTELEVMFPRDREELRP
jgi:type II secretory pathway component PulK